MMPHEPESSTGGDSHAELEPSNRLMSTRKEKPTLFIVVDIVVFHSDSLLNRFP